MKKLALFTILIVLSTIWAISSLRPERTVNQAMVKARMDAGLHEVLSALFVGSQKQPPRP
jgi:hypothetical protein